MPDFALVAEGPTDHAILRNVLIGYFKDQREPEIHRDQPNPMAENAFGGWTLVLHYLREKKYRDALQTNDYLIIQIDTDVAEEIGFDVPRQNANGRLGTEEFIQNVVLRLKEEIGQEDCQKYGERFLFAIGVEQLECWVLPLWCHPNGNTPTVNCTVRLGACEELRKELKLRNLRWIRSEEKNYESYDFASKQYRKHSVLFREGVRSVGLRMFLETLNTANVILRESD